MEHTPTLWEQIWAARHVLFLFSAFSVAVFMAFRPGSRAIYKDAAKVPFRHEDAPAETNEEART